MIRKVSLVTALICSLLLSGCGSIKDTKYTADSKNKIIEQVNTSKDLTQEEKDLFLECVNSGRIDIFGRTVNEIIVFQKDINIKKINSVDISVTDCVHPSQIPGEQNGILRALYGRLNCLIFAYDITNNSEKGIVDIEYKAIVTDSDTGDTLITSNGKLSSLEGWNVNRYNNQYLPDRWPDSRKLWMNAKERKSMALALYPQQQAEGSFSNPYGYGPNDGIVSANRNRRVTLRLSLMKYYFRDGSVIDISKTPKLIVADNHKHVAGSSPTVQTNNAVPSANNAKGVRSISMDAIVGAYESSADKENNYIHSAKLTIDGNVASCWSEGVPGLGIGEHLLYKFNDTYNVYGFKIWIGHQKSSDLFYKNARPTRIRVEGSNSQSEIVRLNDTFGMQTVKLSEPFNTNSIKIIIEEASDGSKWHDTSISEIAFF